MGRQIFGAAMVLSYPNAFTFKVFSIEFPNNPQRCVIRQHINQAMALNYTHATGSGYNIAAGNSWL
jgi:hypothetical protein